MSKTKAGRLGQNDLSAAIAMAAESAKARIEQIDAAAIDAVSGAGDDTVIIGIKIDVDVTMGMFPPVRDPEELFF